MEQAKGVLGLCDYDDFIGLLLVNKDGDDRDYLMARLLCDDDFSSKEQEANAQELVRRWNSQPALLAACKKGLRKLTLPIYTRHEIRMLSATVEDLKAAIKLANPK